VLNKLAWEDATPLPQAQIRPYDIWNIYLDRAADWGID
jgi:hypothetical protein